MLRWCRHQRRQGRHPRNDPWPARRDGDGERERHTERTKMHIYNYSFELTGFLVLNSCRFSQLASCWAGEVARSSQSQVAKDVRGSQKETRAQCSGLGQRAVEEERTKCHGKATYGCKLGQGPCVYILPCVCVVCCNCNLWKFNGWPIRHENHIAWRHLLFYIICRYLQFQSSLLYIVYKRLHGITSLQEKFILQLEIVVKQKNTVTVVVKEQCMSEKELRDELKWSPLLSSWKWYFMHGYRVNIYMLYMSMFFNLI